MLHALHIYGGRSFAHFYRMILPGVDGFSPQDNANFHQLGVIQNSLLEDSHGPKVPH